MPTGSCCTTTELCARKAGVATATTASLWSRLKMEVLELRERPVSADLADAQASVADYFDYYNQERLHSSIDYQTPYYTH
jgi:putative transposase